MHLPIRFFGHHASCEKPAFFEMQFFVENALSDTAVNNGKKMGLATIFINIRRDRFSSDFGVDRTAPTRGRKLSFIDQLMCPYGKKQDEDNGEWNEPSYSVLCFIHKITPQQSPL